MDSCHLETSENNLCQSTKYIIRLNLEPNKAQTLDKIGQAKLENKTQSATSNSSLEGKTEPEEKTKDK